MVIWNILDESSGASQPASQICPHGAAQPLETYVAQCVGIKVVSFGCTSLGLGQHVAGARARARKIRDVLTELRHPAAHDLDSVHPSAHVSDSVLDSVLDYVVNQVSDFRAFVLEFHRFVQEDLPEASYFTDGAYLNLWNVPIQIAAQVQAGTWTASMGQLSYMHWQAFDLTYEAPRFAARDAPQLAAPKVGLLVGQIAISAEHPLAKQRILQQALQHLTSLEVDAWRFRKDFHIMRLLVGDCKLTKESAEAVTQKVHLPPLTALQRDFNFGRWEVCDVDFPRQVLESARTQKLSKPRPKAWPRPKACCLRADPKASLGTRQHKARCSPRPRSCPNT